MGHLSTISGSKVNMVAAACYRNRVGLLFLGSRGAALVFAPILWAVAFVLIVKATRTGIRVSTVTENYFFPLERTFSPERADEFLDLITRETAREEGVTQPSRMGSAVQQRDAADADPRCWTDTHR
jgi:hypothetical protein